MTGLRKIELLTQLPSGYDMMQLAATLKTPAFFEQVLGMSFEHTYDDLDYLNGLSFMIDEEQRVMLIQRPRGAPELTFITAPCNPFKHWPQPEIDALLSRILPVLQLTAADLEWVTPDYSEWTPARN